MMNRIQLLTVLALSLFVVANPTSVRLQAQAPEIDIDFDTDEFSDFGSEDFVNESEVDPAVEEAINFTVLLIGVGLWLASLIICVAIAYLLSDALQALPESARQLHPLLPWLILVPIIQVVVLILAFIKVPRSLKDYLQAQGQTVEGDCGEKIGLIGAILTLVGCTFPIGIVMLFLSLMKIGEAKKVVRSLETGNI